MKILITVLVLAFSASSFATEFHGRISDIDCSISSKGEVTRTQSFGKNDRVGFTETKTITLQNIETILPKVIQVSREGFPSANDEFAYSIKHEGRTYILNYEDSIESMLLVKMIGRICR